MSFAFIFERREKDLFSDKWYYCVKTEANKTVKKAWKCHKAPSKHSLTCLLVNVNKRLACGVYHRPEKRVLWCKGEKLLKNKWDFSEQFEKGNNK